LLSSQKPLESILLNKKPQAGGALSLAGHGLLVKMKPLHRPMPL
jgi:hypothetical protein